MQSSYHPLFIMPYTNLFQGRRGGNVGHGPSNNGNRHLCQLCGKLGYLVNHYWFKFNPNFWSSITSSSNSSTSTNPSVHTNYFQSKVTNSNPLAPPSSSTFSSNGQTSDQSYTHPHFHINTFMASYQSLPNPWASYRSSILTHELVIMS